MVPANQRQPISFVQKRKAVSFTNVQQVSAEEAMLVASEEPHLAARG